MLVPTRAPAEITIETSDGLCHRFEIVVTTLVVGMAHEVVALTSGVGLRQMDGCDDHADCHQNDENKQDHGAGREEPIPRHRLRLEAVDVVVGGGGRRVVTGGSH